MKTLLWSLLIALGASLSSFDLAVNPNTTIGTFNDANEKRTQGKYEFFDEEENMIYFHSCLPTALKEFDLDYDEDLVGLMFTITWEEREGKKVILSLEEVDLEEEVED
jgi:hypothetical protein